MLNVTTEQREKLADYIARVGVTAEAERITLAVFERMIGEHEQEREQRDRTYWMVTLRTANTAFAVPFSLGSTAWWNVRGLQGHRRHGEANMARCNGCGERWPCAVVLRAPKTALQAQPEPPSVTDVLDCLASDASGYDNARDFADWCADYGYNDDSIKAKRMYSAIAEQSRQLRALLGAEAYEQLLWNVERE